MIPFLAPLALKLSPVGAFLKRIPRGVWIVLAVVTILGLGTCAHKRAVSKHYDTAYANGKADEAKRIEAKARKLEVVAKVLAEELRSKANVENHRIAGVADTIRLSGPGKAACLNPATASPGGRIAAGGSRAVAVAAMPDSERIEFIAVPFAGAVIGAEQADLNRAEVLTWREWHRRLIEEWQRDQ